MARTTDEIINEMDLEQASQPDLVELDGPSQTSIYGQIKSLIARCMRTLETLWDRKQDEMETILGRAGVGSTKWVIQKCYEFQYDSVTPQVMELDEDLVPSYPTIDTTKRIITRATVRNNTGVADVRVAKDDPPVALSGAEVTALQDYFTDTGGSADLGVGIGWVGQSLTISSYDADLLYLEGTVYYYGAYANTIQDDVILAVEQLISTLGDNGVLFLKDVESAIRGVPGVHDVLFSNVSARADATPFGSGTDIVLAGVYTRLYQSTAGYMVQETTVGETWADKLVFSAI